MEKVVQLIRSVEDCSERVETFGFYLICRSEGVVEAVWESHALKN